MAKSPRSLAVVGATPAASRFDPPATLGVAGSQLWRKIMGAYRIDDEGGRMLLEQACTMLDRAAELRAAIDRDGAVMMTRNGPKDHPALKHELQARDFVCRSILRLGLDVEPLRPTVGRPGLGFGWQSDGN